MNDFEIRKLISDLLEARKKGEDGCCVISQELAGKIGATLAYLFAFRMRVDMLSEDVLRSTGKEKTIALQTLAQKMGWMRDQRGVKNVRMLYEYLYLTGIYEHDYLRTRDDYDPDQKPMKKNEALEFLTKKHQMESIGATYDRLKRERKKAIFIHKSLNKDFSYLIKMLPSNWESGGIDSFDGQSTRKIDCSLYEQCYGRAAYSNTSLDCSLCKDYTPII